MRRERSGRRSGCRVHSLARALEQGPGCGQSGAHERVQCPGRRRVGGMVPMGSVPPLDLLPHG
jgi:hypothetical protein